MVWGKSPHLSELVELSAHCPVASSEDSLNAPDLPLHNSVLTKSQTRHLGFTVCIIWNVQYRSFWNLWVSCYRMFISLWRQSIVPLWVQITTQCIDYPIWNFKISWNFVDAHLHNGVMNLSCTVLPEIPTITSYMNFFHKVKLTLPKL
jgi:hypothetical protein